MYSLSIYIHNYNIYIYIDIFGHDAATSHFTNARLQRDRLRPTQAPQPHLPNMDFIISQQPTRFLSENFPYDKNLVIFPYSSYIFPSYVILKLKPISPFFE